MDSNSFITPYRQYYNFSIVPSFWKKMEDCVKNNYIKTISQVKDEICVQQKQDKKDELQIWFEETFNCNVIETYKDKNIIDNYTTIMNKLQNNTDKYSGKAINIWSKNKTADGWIISKQ
jgi:hypothetical protein